MDDVFMPPRAAPRELSAIERHRCAACDTAGGREILHLAGVPSNSCLMLPGAAAARGWPRGDIGLWLCEACGFIANRAVEPALTEYSDRYEPTQGWSPAFRRYHRALAARIAATVPLGGGCVVEVGCGQGEFLHLLCGLTGARGIGFDPCVDPRRSDVVEEQGGDVRLVADFFDETAAATLRADLLVCKMTLEHIPAVGHFAALCAQVARNGALGDGGAASGDGGAVPGMRVFIQVPDAMRILRSDAFEDIYYEHCNYFTEASLRAVFARHGFVGEAVWRDFDGQYLGLLARFVGAPVAAPAADAETAALAAGFAAAHRRWVEAWRARLAQAGRVVVWGSGSKGVAFLHALGVGADAVTHAVDINPHRQGMYMIGSGHPIVGPAALEEIRPDTVVVMNRVYVAEVQAMLDEVGVRPRVLAL